MSSLPRNKKKELYKTKINSRSVKLDRPSKTHTDTCPIKDASKIDKMLNYLKLEISINQSLSSWNYFIAYRNYILVLSGLNIPLRVEDLLQLKANRFTRTRFEITENKTMKDQRLYLNEDVRREILKYINEFEIRDEEYLFQSKKTKGNNQEMPISRQQTFRIMQKVMHHIGINQTFGMHTLRKTFGYHFVKNAKNQNTAILTLQKIYNHSSPITTMKYIQWSSDDVEESFKNFNIGIKPGKEKTKR